LKINKLDILGIVLLVIFIIIVSIPVYIPKDGCEVARPGYECESAKNVIIENCRVWGEFNCEHCEKNDWESCIDSSVPSIEWYIGSLCDVHNQHHSDKLDCSNLKLACNTAVGEDVC